MGDRHLPLSPLQYPISLKQEVLRVIPRLLVQGNCLACSVADVPAHQLDTVQSISCATCSPHNLMRLHQGVLRLSGCVMQASLSIPKAVLEREGLPQLADGLQVPRELQGAPCSVPTHTVVLNSHNPSKHGNLQTVPFAADAAERPCSACD